MSFLKKHFIFGILIGFLIGFFSNKFLPSTNTGDVCNVAGPVRLDDKHEFVKPLLLCKFSDEQQFSELADIKEKITDLIDERISENSADKISVYFRSMDNGHWFGVNENEKYSPASLLKVPVMIAYYKEAELNPDLLSKKITYDGSFDFSVAQYFIPKVKIQKDKEYTFDQLIEATIVYSGNNAEILLLKNLDAKTHEKVFTELGVPLITSPFEDYMSARSYSYFFRVLYNTSYLNTEMSEKALKLMSKARFEKGIAAAIPSNTPVSQKFGERTLTDNYGNIQWTELHDCGIIYSKPQPYLLCIMTKGKDVEKLSKAIIEISKLIFKEKDKINLTP